MNKIRSKDLSVCWTPAVCMTKWQFFCRLYNENLWKIGFPNQSDLGIDISRSLGKM